jgi:hypothetical protein
MTTNHVLQKFARRLHRNLFLSVPNNGQQEIDLSKLRPAQNATLEMPALPIQFPMQFDLQFVQQTLITSSQFTPEPWDANHQDR